MRQRRPPLGAMLLGATALLAAWSMAGLAGLGADGRGPRSDPPTRDVPMVVTPPGGSDAQVEPPSRRAPAQPPVRSASTPGAPAGPRALPAPARTSPALARPAPATTTAPTTVPPTTRVPPRPPTTVPPTTVPPTPPSTVPPPAVTTCDVPQDQPPWAEQADLLDLVESTHRVLNEGGSAGFAGFVVTPEECRLDLYWVGPPPREVVEVIGHDRRVVVHDDAAHDHERLSRAAEALAPGSPLGRAAGVAIVSVGVEPEGTGLAVGVEACGTPIDVRATAARLSAGVGVP